MHISSPMFRIALGAIWLVLVAFGGAGIVSRFAQGHHLANYGSYVVWGLWVSGYIYFIGLSAGAFLLSSLVYVFGIRELERAGRLALFVAVITLFMALLTIFFDLGSMWRFYRVFTSPNFLSMMAWMVWLYTAYFVLLIAELWLAMRPGLSHRQSAPGVAGSLARLLARNEGPLSAEQEREGREWLRVMGAFGIPLAIAFHGGVGSLFGTVAAHPLWHTPLMPILFLTGALVSGGGFMAFIFSAFWPTRDAQYARTLALLGKAVLGLILLDVLFEWAEFSIPMWYGIGPEYTLLMNILVGPYWYVFWGAHILLGTLIPVYLLVRHGKNPMAVGTAGLLVGFTFLAVRLNMVIPALTDPSIEALQRSFRDTRLTFSYLPSTFEWQLLLGMVAIGIALFYLGYKILPLTTEERTRA